MIVFDQRVLKTGLVDVLVFSEIGLERIMNGLTGSCITYPISNWVCEVWNQML